MIITACSLGQGAGLFYTSFQDIGRGSFDLLASLPPEGGLPK